MPAMRSPHLVVILAGYAAGAALYSRLPNPDFWQGRPMAAFLLPTAAATTFVLLRSLYARHPVDGGDTPTALATCDAVMLRLVAFLIGVHVVVLLLLTGTLARTTWTARIVPVLLGLTMIGIGNLLPRTRPNLAIGIRTSRTLGDSALWMHMHRIAGYALVASGIVVVIAALTLPAPVGPGMIQLVAPAALLGVPVLLRRSRKHAA